MNKTKIDWCTHTLNPVVGCTFNCPYCYARKMNTRFKWIPKWDEPQFFPERLKMLESKTPKIIFMDSVSDIADWERDWIERIFTACKDNPQHTYLFLTKRPAEALPYPWFRYFNNKNWWIGTSINGTWDISRTVKLWEETTPGTNRFLSIEPIMGPIDFKIMDINWVIVGAETGNRKDKVIPEREWIEEIAFECKKAGIPLFMKGSLKDIWGENLIQEFPSNILRRAPDGSNRL